MSQPEITLFSVPKPFEGVTNIQQRNAIQSWQRLGEQVEIVLIGDDRGTAEAARDLAVRHIPRIERNEYGTPLVSSAFQLGATASTSRLLCYVNADIVLMSDFSAAVRNAWSRPFLMCGRRWDVDLEFALDFTSATWQDQLRQRVQERGRLHASTGIDYFVFSRGVFSAVPPFSIGRTVWDNWLVFHARALGIPVIDATDAVMAVHQNHQYQHVRGGIQAAWNGPEARQNQALAEDMLVPFTIDDATLCLSRAILARNTARAHLSRLPQAWAALGLRERPVLRELVRRAARSALAGRS